jgi:tRNA(Ile)-lysidine synthetase-like protein
MATQPSADPAAAVLAAQRSQGLFRAGETVLVALSGGPDSVALLALLVSLAPQLGLLLEVAHVDHRLRPDSSGDAEFAARLAAVRGLPFHLEATVPAKGQSGPEAAAREARYAALAAIARRAGLATVAVGHTADDQAETVLMNLLRGSGAAGLAGMRPVAAWPGPAGGPDPDLRLVRPLLALRREDLRAYLEAEGLDWREDASNSDRRFLRNRVRHDLLPALEALNPRVVAALGRYAAGAAEDEEVLGLLVEAAWTAVVREAPRGLTLLRGPFAEQPPAVQRRLLRRAADCLAGRRRELGWEAVERLRRLALDHRPDRLDLPGDLQAVSGKEGLRLERPR